MGNLLAQKDFPELLMFIEPELGLRNRGPEWLCEGFLRDHPGSLDARVRNDAADCADADECDSDCNDHSDREARDPGTHGRSPIFCEARWVCARGGIITQFAATSL
jgi:hypothetical protein